ncbi:hypothetical protein OG225_07055 [Nocardia sp. NBC_01377]|uniref:hypothetical protein n=1 Tax=Nocardia sp. NBC_01377 TaxID=2903595 RepID=UPI003255BE74
MPIDQPPSTPQTSEIRHADKYVKEQEKIRRRREERRRKSLDAESRRRTSETKQQK